MTEKEKATMAQNQLLPKNINANEKQQWKTENKNRQKKKKKMNVWKGLMGKKTFYHIDHNKY